MHIYLPFYRLAHRSILLSNFMRSNNKIYISRVVHCVAVVVISTVNSDPHGLTRRVIASRNKIAIRTKARYVSIVRVFIVLERSFAYI
mgnify:FL=1